FFFSSRRRHTRSKRDWSSDVCSSDLMHFFGGGIIGQLLFQFSSTGVSLSGTLILGLIFIYFCYLIIASKDIEQTLSKDLANLGKWLRQIRLMITRGAVKVGSGTKQIYGKLSERSKGQKSAAGYETAGKKPGKYSKKEKASLQKDSQLPKISDDFEPDESLIEDMNTFEPEVRPDAPQEKKEAE